jgi:hypothetical protein
MHHIFRLRNDGVKNELISLSICIILGLVLGLMFEPWIETYGVTQWPTQEMLSRGQYRSLYVGVLIAIPSGAGVALSVLGGNAGSLVGVAISASLLPPAVNCGIFWAIAILFAATPGQEHLRGFVLFSDPMAENSTLPVYVPTYSDTMSIEAFALGIVSFALTIVNIICIIVTGIIILKVKQVTPDKIPQTFSSFWKRDVRAHKDYYHTLKRPDRMTDGDDLLQEAREVLGIGVAGNEDGLEGTFLQSVFEKAQAESNVFNIRDWVASPYPGAAQRGGGSVSRPARLSMQDMTFFEQAPLRRQATVIRRARFRHQVESILEEVGPAAAATGERKRSATFTAAARKRFHRRRASSTNEDKCELVFSKEA